MSDNNELTKAEGQQLEITEINGRTQIVFRKAILKGKVTQSEVLNTLLIAAKMQGEYYIKKLSKGAPLDTSEVKALKELAEITKLQCDAPEVKKVEETVQMNDIKSVLYAALTEKLRD